VQTEPVGARLRITGQVEVGLQGRDHRAVGLVEQRGEARVEAGRCLGVGRQLGESAVRAEILPACNRVGPPDRRSDPRGLLRLAVGAAGVGEDRWVADSGYHRHVGVIKLQAQQQAGAGGVGQFTSGGDALVMRDKRAVIGVGQADDGARRSPSGDVPQALSKNGLWQWCRRASGPHHHCDHRPAQAEQATVVDVPHRVGPQFVHGREQMGKHPAGHPLPEHVAEHQQAGLVGGACRGPHLGTAEPPVIVDQPQVAEPGAAVAHRHAEPAQNPAGLVTRNPHRAGCGLEPETP
jgi:hypothetical protein